MIRTADGGYEIYGSLSDFDELLSSGFVRCHQSYIVNLSAVRSMERDAFRLQNGMGVPISKSRSAEARRAFLKHIGEKL